MSHHHCGVGVLPIRGGCLLKLLRLAQYQTDYHSRYSDACGKEKHIIKSKDCSRQRVAAFSQFFGVNRNLTR
ncbi:hypothetical protein D3C75_1096500 [compost metagenome]